MNINTLLCKILNRFGLLANVNLHVPVRVYGRQYQIPVLAKMGFEHLYANEDHDSQVYAFFRHVISRGAFIDIGANLGQTILKVVPHAPKSMVCVEPNPFCVSYLEELKRGNGLGSVQIVPAAIFDQSGVQTLYLLSRHHTGASLVADDRPNYFDVEQQVLVNAITGKQLAALVSDSIAFMKIDVEGAELPVLQSLQAVLQRDKPVIYCEILDAHSEEVLQRNDENKKALQSFISSIGYRIHRFDSIAQRLIEVSQFPSRLYDAKNLADCNYVLMPG